MIRETEPSPQDHTEWRLLPCCPHPEPRVRSTPQNLWPFFCTSTCQGSPWWSQLAPPVVPGSDPGTASITSPCSTYLVGPPRKKENSYRQQTDDFKSQERRSSAPWLEPQKPVILPWSPVQRLRKGNLGGLKKGRKGVWEINIYARIYGKWKRH